MSEYDFVDGGFHNMFDLDEHDQLSTRHKVPVSSEVSCWSLGDDVWLEIQIDTITSRTDQHHSR